MGDLKLNGATSGTITLTPTAVAGTNTITLPASTGTVALTASPTFSGTLTATTITSPASTALTIQSAGTTAMTVDTSQNVGIGTTSPSAKLHTSGAGIVEQLNSSTSFAAKLFVSSTTTGLGRYIAAEANDMTFGRYGVAEQMRIDSSGNLLVGTTSVLGKQTISYDGSTAFGLALANTASGTAGQIAIRFMRNGSDVGSVTTTNTATAYNTSSDYRLKNTIVPMSSGLATIAALNPVTYKWNIDGSDSEGFIAHELQEVIPHAVTGEKDAVDDDGNPRHQGVDYSKIVVHLVAALQELSAKNDALEARLAALEAK